MRRRIIVLFSWLVISSIVAAPPPKKVSSAEDFYVRSAFQAWKAGELPSARNNFAKACSMDPLVCAVWGDLEFLFQNREKGMGITEQACKRGDSAACKAASMQRKSYALAPDVHAFGVTVSSLLGFKCSPGKKEVNCIAPKLAALKVVETELSDPSPTIETVLTEVSKINCAKGIPAKIIDRKGIKWVEVTCFVGETTGAKIRMLSTLTHPPSGQPKIVSVALHTFFEKLGKADSLLNRILESARLDEPFTRSVSSDFAVIENVKLSAQGTASLELNFEIGGVRNPKGAAAKFKIGDASNGQFRQLAILEGKPSDVLMITDRAGVARALLMLE